MTAHHISDLSRWFDQRIKARFDEAGKQWSVAVFAREAGVPEHTARGWVRSGYIPDARWVRGVARALQVSVDELLALIEAEAEAADVRRALAAAEAARRVRPKGRRRG